MTEEELDIVKQVEKIVISDLDCNGKYCSSDLVWDLITLVRKLDRKLTTCKEIIEGN
jgi:hypothetical protein